MRKSSKSNVPLIIEHHPDDYKGYPFITLLQYRQDHILTIVDNSNDKEIRAVVLDCCAAENINEELIINIASDWYETNREKYPLSFEFSKRDLASLINPIYKRFNVEFVSRVIGPLFHFPMGSTGKVKRRKIKKTLPTGMQVVPLNRR